MSEERDDFYQQIKTKEAGTVIGIGAGDLGLLIQMGTEDNFDVAYLSDKQAKQLSDALLAYIALPK